MSPSTSCCSSHPVRQAHLTDAVSAAGAAIKPANHAAGISVGATADLLVLGAISTGNPAAPTAEAMAISGGQIIGLGSAADVEGLVTASTTTVKPEGVVIPGFIEPRMHIWTSLLNLTWTDLSKDACPTFDDVVALVKSTAQKTPAGQYVMGKLFEPSLYPGEPSLTRAILDQAAPQNPVVVMNASMATSTGSSARRLRCS
jgi:predicted amidohydrolase YtcJ